MRVVRGDLGACRLCGAPHETVSLKSPHIDDWRVQCSNPACEAHNGLEILHALERLAARSELARL